MSAAVEEIVHSFMNNIEQILATSDLNRDGGIDREELVNVLLRANTPWPLASSLADEVMARLDRNRDGKISLADNIPSIVEELVHAFAVDFLQVLRTTDLNSDGSIEQAELINVLVRTKMPWASAKTVAAEVFARLDRNGDHRISLQDILDLPPQLALAPPQPKA